MPDQGDGLNLEAISEAVLLREGSIVDKETIGQLMQAVQLYRLKVAELTGQLEQFDEMVALVGKLAQQIKELEEQVADQACELDDLRLHLFDVHDCGCPGFSEGDAA